MTISLSGLIRLGRRVDPVIYQALARSSSPGFLPTVNYHFRVGGKRMRAAMVMLSCAASGGKLENALRPAAVVEMIHNYSLVMDDIIDRGLVRRGKPTLRVTVGDSVSLLVAMFYREVLDDLIEQCNHDREVRTVAVQTMKEIIDGERMDLLFEQTGREDPYVKRNRIKNLDLSLYLEMIGKKTASLFKAASQIGGYSAGASSRAISALGSFGWTAGLAFQVMDDVLDLCGNKTGKQEGKDVVEHKLGSAPILVALRFLPLREGRELMGILRTQRVSQRMVERARNIVATTPAEAVCREVAQTFLKDGERQLASVRDSSDKSSLLHFAKMFVSRSF